MDLSVLIVYLQIHTPALGLLIALFTGAFRIKKLLPAILFLIVSYAINVLVPYFGFAFIAGRYLGEYFDVFLILMLTFLSYKGSKKNSLFLILGFVLLLAYLTVRWSFQPNFTFPNISGVAGNLANIALCLTYFYHLIKSDDELHLLNPISFGITTFIFFYEAGGFFTSIMIDFIIQNGGENAFLYRIQNVISICTYLAFTWMIWKTWTSHKNQKIQETDQEVGNNIRKQEALHSSL